MSLQQALERLAHEVPSMRQYLVPMLRRAHEDALPEGFDFFNDDETSPQDLKPVDPDTAILRQIEQHLHGMPETMSAASYLAPAGMRYLASPRLLYWARQAWSVQVHAADKATAHRLGQMIQKNLLSKKHLTYSMPYLYQEPLFVRFSDGWVKLEGLVPVEKAPELKQNHLKDQVKLKGERVFGAGSIRISGSDGAYRLMITPKLKIHRGVFRETTVGAATVAELGQKLDQAIERIQAILASR